MSELTAPAKLRQYLERIERLEEERKTIADDIADVYRELDGDGFDKHAAKAVLKIRKSADGLTVWTDRSALVDTYLVALGMVPEVEPRAPARTREMIEEVPHGKASEGMDPSTVSISPPGSQPSSGGDGANTGGSHVNPPTFNADRNASLAAREGEEAAASHSKGVH